LKKGRLFVFSAPSGSGKTTIVKAVMAEYKELVFSISATTRANRLNEKDGIDYFFLDENSFKELIEKNEFIEWERFYDYYYGTLRSFVESNINDGKSLVLEVDVKGALKIKSEYPNSVLIFIAPPGIEELKKRLSLRNTESEEDFHKRIERAELELSFKDKFDYVILNYDLNSAKQNVLEIIEKEINKE